MNGNDAKQNGNERQIGNDKQNELKTENGTDSRPLWQQISGIDPANELKMEADARDTAIRKLVQEVEQRAGVEIERAANGKVPAGERTAFWDPLTRICLQLGISRTKLSLYTRELTGMRAHEISDRILARRVLRIRMTAYVENIMRAELEGLKKSPNGIHPGMRAQLQQRFVRWVRSLRMKERRAGFAAGLGFANPSRLSRACLLGLGMSIDELEARIVCTLVQKFFSEMGAVNPAMDQFTRMRQEMRAKHERMKKQGMALSEESVLELEKMIDEAECEAKAG